MILMLTLAVGLLVYMWGTLLTGGFDDEVGGTE